MNFLNPFLLLGLLAVAIPVLIHLINLRRPQKVPFSTLSFLNELKKSTIRRVRIKQYLLMTLRVLAVLCLALALARPFLPPTLTGSSGSEAPKTIGILIDNSASMNRIGTRGPLIDQAKDIAATIVQGARSDDRFMVAVTNGEQPPVTLQGNSDARQRIESIEATNTGNYVSDAMQLLFERIQQAPAQQAVIYLLTDGQKSQLENLQGFSSRQPQTKSVSLQMVELGDVNQQNLAVSGLSLNSQMLSSGSPVVLQVEVTNYGDVAAVNQFVSLEVEGRMAGQYQVELPAGQSREYLFEIIPDKVGDISGEINLDGDEVTYDNSRYFVLRIPESRSVLLLGGEDESGGDFRSYLKPALEAARQTNTQITFDERSVDDVDQADLGSYDVIVFDGLDQVPEYWFEELQRFVQNGRGILFFPSEQGDINNYNDFFRLFNGGSFENVTGEYASFQAADEFDELVEGHPILDELFDKEEEEEISLDLPDLFFYYNYDLPDNTGAIPILRSENGSPLLTEQRFGDGRLLVSSYGTDPGWSNFPVNPLFAPLYYRSVLYASSSEQGGFEQHSLGQAFEWQGDLQNSTIEIIHDEQLVRPEVTGMPEGVRVSYEGREWTPGIYTITDGTQSRLVAVNQNIMESHFVTLSSQELEKMLSNYVTINTTINAGELSRQNLEEELNTASFGKEIWSWFVWLAILLLIAEMVVSRLYQTENVN